MDRDMKLQRMENIYRSIESDPKTLSILLEIAEQYVDLFTDEEFEYVVSHMENPLFVRFYRIQKTVSENLVMKKLMGYMEPQQKSDPLGGLDKLAHFMGDDDDFGEFN